jgi:hypothetical protein
MTLRGLLAPVLHFARHGIVVSPNPFEYRRTMLLALVLLATVVSFAPVPGLVAASLIPWDRGREPDPNQYVASYTFGVALPWVTVVHKWCEAAGRSQWSYNSFDSRLLGAHLAFQSLVGGLVMLLWARGRGHPKAGRSAASRPSD